MPNLREIPSLIVNLGVTEDCDQDEATTRRVSAGSSLFVCAIAPIWGAMYAWFDEPWSGLIPSSYSAITAVSFVALWRFGGWQWFRVSQLFLIFVLPFTLMWSLGGFIPSSAVMLWAILAPIGALWAGRSREALAWTVAFLATTVFSGVIDSSLSDTTNLPDALITVMFVMNISFVSTTIFLLLDFFVREKDSMIAVMRRNRELEAAYLDQEVTLRQSEKLATLGKLSAGLAHELNNPVSAAQQATHQLSSLLLTESQVNTDFACLDLTDGERVEMERYAALTSERVDHPEFLDPLDRSDAESEIQSHLEEADIDRAWEFAPSLVALGLGVADLRSITTHLRGDRLAPAVETLAMQFERRSLLSSLAESTSQTIEIVNALKSYSYLDRAPRQFIDLHEGLDATLVIMQNRLKAGIRVERNYCDELPLIEAYGNELNQVWTNLLDNSLDAMGSTGAVTITTQAVGDGVVVEMVDDGPGIPEEVIATVFDPFVTTKPPGEGTGLGLNISHNIITQRHAGTISVESSPGRTAFTINLPIIASEIEPSSAAVQTSTSTQEMDRTTS